MCFTCQYTLLVSAIAADFVPKGSWGFIAFNSMLLPVYLSSTLFQCALPVCLASMLCQFSCRCSRCCEVCQFFSCQHALLARDHFFCQYGRELCLPLGLRDCVSFCVGDWPYALTICLPVCLSSFLPVCLAVFVPVRLPVCGAIDEVSLVCRSLN